MDHPGRQAAHGAVIAAPEAVVADDSRPGSAHARLAELRALALSGLPMMFDPAAGLFCFRVERRENAIARVGLSRRYTAITLLGLSGEHPDTAASVLAGQSLRDAVDRLAATIGPRDSLGDLALTAWAAGAVGRPADAIWTEIASRDPIDGAFPTVEVAWTLSAAAAAPEAARSTLGRALASRLARAFSRESALFPHHLGESAGRARAHVSCFADLVYPVLALASWGRAVGDATAIDCALKGAEAMCRHQGPDGQWWWHYDYRTGCLLERFPVYAVHQDAMAPMALLAATDAAGVSFDQAVSAGLDWLFASPELQGGSLIDRKAGLIWRKVARREPGKLSRYLQAGASRVSSTLRAPGLDVIFPPNAIDYEDRPYHLGWVLYAWPSARAAAWPPAADRSR